MFDWDEANITHIARHGITPDEAEQALHNDPTDAGLQNVDGEDRFIDIGVTDRMRLLIVVTTLRGDLTRVVTAYDATPAFREVYFKRKGSPR
jgi:uncharacterized DUF497 family protein